MVNESLQILAGSASVVMGMVGFYAARPFAWWLFRLCHRNNPDALAFADREQHK